MIRNSILSLAVLAAATLGGGCKSTTLNTTGRAEPVAERNYITDKRVITDGSLNRTVRILGVDAPAPEPDQHLKVQVELYNTRRSAQTFSYLWEWFDENGQIVRTPVSNARSRMIEGRESIFITATAPTPQARDFRLKLIENLR